MDHPKYKESTVNEIFKTATDAKVSEPAIKMATEYLRLFTLEAIHRSAESSKRKKEGELLDVQHLQENAAALTLDFS